MKKHLFQSVSLTKEQEKIAAQERLIIEVASRIWNRNKQRGNTLEGLAGLVGTKKAQISRLLSGDANMTLRTLSDLAFALECQAEFILVPKWAQENQFRPYEAPQPSKLGKVRVSQSETFVQAQYTEIGKAA